MREVCKCRKISLLNDPLHTLCVIPLWVIDFEEKRMRMRKKKKKKRERDELDRGYVFMNMSK